MSVYTYGDRKLLISSNQRLGGRVFKSPVEA